MSCGHSLWTCPHMHQGINRCWKCKSLSWWQKRLDMWHVLCSLCPRFNLFSKHALIQQFSDYCILTISFKIIKINKWVNPLSGRYTIAFWIKVNITRFNVAECKFSHKHSNKCKCTITKTTVQRTFGLGHYLKIIKLIKCGPVNSE